MEKFPHLKFATKIKGKPRYGRVIGENERSNKNKEHRQQHSEYLSDNLSNVKARWVESQQERNELNLPTLDSEVIPVLLQINPDIINNVEFNLQSLGVEIISEEENGYILGASLDNLNALEEKIRDFITAKHGSGKISELWDIVVGDRSAWKPKHILSEELYAKWHTISDDEVFNIEVGIAFDKPLNKAPDPSKRGAQKRIASYEQKLIDRDNALMEREGHFEEFLSNYGTLKSGFIYLEDSFSCEIEISGLGLKDLVENYQFVFEVSEVDTITVADGIDIDNIDSALEIQPPDDDAYEVGVIDSGIMEDHKYLAQAIRQQNSKSYIAGDNSTADYVRGGGHGTKVAGAILYPQGVSLLTTPYKLPCFVRNLRVLDKNNGLLTTYPAQLMSDIVFDNTDCKIFNLSITSNAPYKIKHMSSWAAIIDKFTHEEDTLFIVAVGNISQATVKGFYNANKNYPTYLQEPSCRIANPSQSCFAISVGSVNHTDFEDDYWKSLGTQNQVSAFSRIGTGIWGGIKPDVVEFGGGIQLSKNGLNGIRENHETSPELIRSTLHGGGAYGKDGVGTSFAAPKVSHIAANLKRLYPDENVSLLRALIVHGARVPEQNFLNPTKESIQHFGYGIPSFERVTQNTEHRITFYNTGTIQEGEAQIYTLLIPEELRNPANEYDILIEVTLAYTAKVRRTRQKTKSYLSSWLDWTTSNVGEPFDDFKKYILKEIEGIETSYDKQKRNELPRINWKIKNSIKYGVEGIRRNDGTVQKDWSVIKSFSLPKEISFAVRGHKGWDKNSEEIPYALAVSIEILGSNIPIYESIKVANEVESEQAV